jgi:RNA polymerase-binding transcription factor DksA
MKAASYSRTVPSYSCAGTTHCVLCGKRIGAVRFKGHPVCKSCIEYARTIS